MKKKYSALFLLAVLAGIAAACARDDYSARRALSANQYAQTKVYYSLDGQADKAIVAAIQNARTYVYFAVYTLTKENIANALIAAKIRGLDVRGILDANQITLDQEKPWIKKFRMYGIEIKTPLKQDGLMHLKMLVTDRQYASGSFNWTVSAAIYNDDVVEIGEVTGIHDQYLAIFKKLFAKY
ncbi:hypothetical protein KGQ24_02285 [Patescibacteria group bacterium]|nr:hypothetical protein [Patescibacteria group bacterium]